MAIGKRIRFFRNRKGMTQKQLGEILGFLGKTSDVRMAQYETEARTPKHDLVKEMANIFDVSTHALTVPDIDTFIGLMHTLFALEDMYGLKIGEIDGEICLRLDKSDYSTYTSMFDMFHAWQEQAAKLEQGEISGCRIRCCEYIVYFHILFIVIEQRGQAVFENIVADIIVA